MITFDVFHHFYGQTVPKRNGEINSLMKIHHILI
jgi:hypothetical protein